MQVISTCHAILRCLTRNIVLISHTEIGLKYQNFQLRSETCMLANSVHYLQLFFLLKATMYLICFVDYCLRILGIRSTIFPIYVDKYISCQCNIWNDMLWKQLLWWSAMTSCTALNYYCLQITLDEIHVTMLCP